MSLSKSRHRTWIYAFLGAVFVLYCIWMVTVPMERAPDEQVRVILSNSVWQHGSLPNAWDPEVRIYDWGFSYALRPMLVNIIGAFFMGVVSLFTTDPWAMLLAVRFVSVLSGVIFVLYAFKIALALGWKEHWVWVFACLCALTPQISFLAAYNNNDLFSLMCTTMIVFYWIEGNRLSWSWPVCIKLGLVLGITCLSYYNTYPYVLMSVVVYFFSYWKQAKTGTQKKEMWLKAAAIAGLAFLMAGWWFIRNIVLYHGDVLGSKTRLEMGELYADADKKPSTVWKAKREGISLFKLIFGVTRIKYPWIVQTFESLIAKFAMNSLMVAGWIYPAAAAFLGAGLIARIVRAIQNGIAWVKAKSHAIGFAGMFYLANVICMLAVFFLSAYYSWTDDYQAQGRYLMPAFSSLMLFVVQGWILIAGWLKKAFRQPKLPAWIANGICVVMVIFQLYCLFGVVRPDSKGVPKLNEHYLETYWIPYNSEKAAGKTG